MKKVKEATKQKDVEITKKNCNSTKTANKDLKHIQPTKSTQKHPSTVVFTVANSRDSRRTTKYTPLQTINESSSPSNYTIPISDLKYDKINENSLKYTKDNSQELPFQNKPDYQQKPIVDCAQRSFWISTVNYRIKLTSPKIQQPNYMNLNNHVDNIMFKKSDPLFNIKVESNPLKDNDLADRVTEAYHNNLITIGFMHKLDENDMHFKNNYKKSSNTILSNDYNFVGSKKLTCKPPLELGNTLYENNDASSNGDSENFNAAQQQPKQYFMTPLPMKIDDFNIFLKNHEIDVESVTAPLRHPVPFSASITDKWKLNKKYVPKSLNKTFLLEGYKSKKGKDLKLDTNVKFTDYDIENVKKKEKLIKNIKK
ncbi:unnamed protein product, partial [Brenthis ino]